MTSTRKVYESAVGQREALRKAIAEEERAKKEADARCHELCTDHCDAIRCAKLGRVFSCASRASCRSLLRQTESTLLCLKYGYPPFRTGNGLFPESSTGGGCFSIAELMRQRRRNWLQRVLAVLMTHFEDRPFKPHFIQHVDIRLGLTPPSKHLSVCQMHARRKDQTGLRSAVPQDGCPSLCCARQHFVSNTSLIPVFNTPWCVDRAEASEAALRKAIARREREVTELKAQVWNDVRNVASTPPRLAIYESHGRIAFTPVRWVDCVQWVLSCSIANHILEAYLCMPSCRWSLPFARLTYPNSGHVVACKGRA